MCVYLQFEAKWPEEEGMYLMRRGRDNLPDYVWYSKLADAIFDYATHNRKFTRNEYKRHFDESEMGSDPTPRPEHTKYLPYQFACLAIEKPVIDVCIEDPLGEAHE